MAYKKKKTGKIRGIFTTALTILLHKVNGPYLDESTNPR